MRNDEIRGDLGRWRTCSALCVDSSRWLAARWYATYLPRGTKGGRFRERAV